MVVTSTVNVFAYSNKRFIGLLCDRNEGCVYKKDNGEYARNEWVNVNYEGRSFWYYISDNKHPISAKMSPDGFKVNLAGHWIDESNLSNFYNDFYEYDIMNMLSKVTWIFSYRYDMQDTLNMNIKRENLTSEDKAFLTYAYIYNDSDDRYSIINKEYESYHVVSKENVMAIMRDLTGSSNENDVRAFTKYATIKDNKYWVELVGNFGDAGRAYLSKNDLQLSIEGNRVMISGDVLLYKEEVGYIPVKKFNAYFVISNAPYMDFLLFDEFLIQ